MSFTAAQKGKAKALPVEEPTDDTLSTGSASDSDSLSEDSDSDSDSDSSLSSGSDDDSDEDFSPAYLESLIEKAKQNARAIAARKAAFGFENDEEEVIKLDVDKPDPKLPSLNPGDLPPTYIEANEAGPSRIRDPDVERTQTASAALSVPSAPAPPRSALTKKQRKEAKSNTAGGNWFDLPAPVEADLPRLYREVEALRLRNQLDPKRFYRKDPGEGKGIKGLPKYFVVGKIIETKSPFGGASSENLARTSRKRTLVDELVDDAEARSYAKKKFRELQTIRGARGRGTLAKKMAARRQKW